jgi:hypothetical protein
MPDTGSSIRHFLRLADRRAKQARFLLLIVETGGDIPDGVTNLAVETAAMAVECSLKALILNSTPIGRRAGAEELFHGSRPHDREWLKNQLIVRGIVLPREIVKSLSRMEWWPYHKRYDLKNIPHARASDFLSAADDVMSWAENRF